MMSFAVVDEVLTLGFVLPRVTHIDDVIILVEDNVAVADAVTFA